MKLFAVLYMLFAVCLTLGSLALSIYGFVLAFSASVILGILTFFIQPAPLIFGAVMFFFEKDLAQLIVNALSN